MILLTIFGFSVIGIANNLSSKYGIKSFKHGDKDILFPFCTMIFIFFSLLIYLPEVNSKINNIQKYPTLNQNKQQDQQQQSFPLAFLFVLASITLTIIIDRFFLNNYSENRSDDQKKLYDENHQHTEQDASTLKYFLTLAITFINISDAYFITFYSKKQSLLAELIVFGIFSQVINFSYGYLLGWIQIQKEIINKLMIFTNIGLFIGFIMGLFLKISIAIIILPCIGIAFALYSSVFLCMPKIFTNGKKPVQDKFRYWAIFTSLLLSILYYPIIYLLKI